MGNRSASDGDQHDDPDLSHVQPETGDSEVCDENDESGLPEPQKYDRPYFDVFDYLSDEYADARNLNEAIDMRGQKAFAQSLTPDDFSDASPDNMTKMGIAELWAESTWNDGRSTRNIALERSVAGVQELKFVVAPRKSTRGDTCSIVWTTVSRCRILPTMISTTGSFLECWTTCPKTNG